MGINIQLWNETGDVLGQFDDADMTLSGPTRKTFSGTRVFTCVVHLSRRDLQSGAGVRPFPMTCAAVPRSHAGTPLAGSLEAISPLLDRLAAKTTSNSGS